MSDLKDNLKESFLISKAGSDNSLKAVPDKPDGEKYHFT